MVHFSETLESRIHPDFAGYYIDYAGLKMIIHDLKELRGNPDSPEYISELRHKAEIFAQTLDYNINRAAIFYEEKLEENVLKLRSIRRKWVYLSPETLPQIYEQLKDVARGIGSSLAFVELNAEAVRKILKKAEKNLLGIFSRNDPKATNRPRLPSQISIVIGRDAFIRSRLRPDRTSASRLEALRVYCGVDKVVEELRRRCDTVRSLEAVWFEEGIVCSDYVHRVHERRDTLSLLTDLHAAVQSTVKTTKWYYGSVALAQIDYEKEPIGDANAWGLFLNNFNTFLYIANTYSVIPTANYYVAAVGLPPMVSGVLLAITSLSAMLASIVYSLWSNRSFKQPLLFSTLLLLIGNALYGMALDHRSASMLFLGRLLVGLGGNRAVNRRYIADFVRIEDRTFHSAMFVTVSSLGTCLGPGCQHFFNMIDFKLPYFGYTVNYITSSGWIAALLWLIFALQITFYFSEPVRRVAVDLRQNHQGLLQPLLAAPEPVVAYTNRVTASPSSPVKIFSQNVLHETDPRTFYNYPHTTTMQIQELQPTPKSQVECDIDGAVVCLWVYFVLKLVQEAFQTAAPMYTASAFQWKDDDVGYFLAVIGLVVLPVNVATGSVGTLISDRVMNVISLVSLGVGAAFAAGWGNMSPPILPQFMFGALTVFVSAQCLESASMSLLSKVMPKIMSRGLWNSGFLSTEAGAFGRVVGASSITLMGSVSGLMGDLNVLELQLLVMTPCVILVIITLVFVIWKWKSLAPLTERMSKNIATDADAILESETWKHLPELRPLCVQIQAASLPPQQHSAINKIPVIRKLTAPFFFRDNRQLLSE